MTTQQIKDNAPDGATHIDKNGEYWKIGEDGKIYMNFSESIPWISYFYKLSTAKRKYKLKPL